jgi:peptidoglycan/LPS O-acetylase OafA/YrhL
MEYFLNLTFTFGLVPGYQNSIVPAGWSIGTEMIFYAIFPLCLIFAQGLARSIWLVGLLVLVGWTANQAFRAAGFAHLLFYWTNVFTNLPYFGIGIIACAVFKRLAEYPEKAVLARLLLATSVAAGVLLATFGSTPCSDFSAEPPALWETLGWGLVFAAVATSQALRPSRLVANPAATALGKISFSLYLIHPLVFHAFPVIPAIERWTVLPAFKLLAVWTFGFAVMIPLAYVAFHLVEVPGQLVGRWLSERERRLPYGRWRKAN